MDVNGALAAGFGIPILHDKIPGNLSLEWTISANTLEPVLRTSAGVVYRIDLGKEGRTHLEAYAKLNFGLSEEGYLGPNFGFHASHDMNKDGTWALGGGGGVGLRENGNLAFVEASVDINHSARLQKKIRDFKKAHSESMKVTEQEAIADINSLNVDPVLKKMLIRQYERYINGRIEVAVTQTFVGREESQDALDFVLHQIKIVSFGLTAAVGLEAGGFAVGPYITIGIGYRAITLYVPPL